MIAELQLADQTVSSNEEESQTPEQRQEESLVEAWLGKIEKGKKKWNPDFKRMREDMEFVSGLQWPGQEGMETQKTIINLTIQAINNKVATLYAKNPKAVARPRKRLEYQVWNGEVESLIEGIGQGELIVGAGGKLPPEISALFNDFQAGQTRKELVAKICKSLEMVYDYQVQKARPGFKEQFKQKVRRVCTTGVGYVRPIYCSQNQAYSQPNSVDVGSSVADMAGRVKELLRQIEETGEEDSDVRVAAIKNLAASMGASTQDENLASELDEKIEFDFLPSTSVIPDPACRSLKEFVSAGWIAIEFPLPREDVNAIFDVEVKTDASSDCDNNNTDQTTPKVEDKQQETVYVYEILSKRDKTHMFVCKGYKKFLQPPAPVTPSVDGFWPIVSLTFNDTEVEPETKASIFPPSDVRLIMPVQREWNRTQDALRQHRIASAPRYAIRQGSLTEEDEEKLRTGEAHEILRLQGVDPSVDISRAIAPIQTVPIDERLYETDSLEKNLMLCAGMQQANLGAAQPNVTATVGSIAEASRQNASASNIDDLDGALTRLAQMCGEIILQLFSPETVMRIVGPGAAWPVTPEMKADFLNEISLEIEASSSGRPNKAMDIQNWTQLGPMLQAAGVNPMGLVDETAKRLDDNLDVSKFLPLAPPAGALLPSSGGPSQPSSPPSTGKSAPSAAPRASQKGTATA